MEGGCDHERYMDEGLDPPIPGRHARSHAVKKVESGAIWYGYMGPPAHHYAYSRGCSKSRGVGLKASEVNTSCNTKLLLLSSLDFL